MLPDNVLQDIYDHFRQSGQWPFVRELQVAHRSLGNLRHLAAQTGSDRVVCEGGPDGRCFLRVVEVAQRRGSEDDVSNFVATIRIVSLWYAEHGSTPLSSSDIAEELKLDDHALGRLGLLLYRESGPWSGGSWSHDGTSFSVQPSEEALFYDSVETMNDYFAARQRYAEEAVATSRLLMRPRPFVHEQVGGLQARPPHVNLADASLQAMLERDLAELDSVLRVHAWKAASVLAGSCLETVLLDIWKRDEEAAKAKFGGDWPNRVSSQDLAKAAVAAGLIHQDHAIAGDLLRRWRDVIHPAAELRASEPHEQLAQALVAILYWLLAHLAGQEAK